jgi:flagellar M-ring protein FliF
MWQAILGSLKDLNDQWAKMSPGKKTAAMSVAFVLVVCTLALGVWVGEKSYSPLYTNLAPEESINLVKMLQEENIPYLVTKDGTTISIPPELVQPTLMKLAVRGTTDGHKPGLEIFDKESFGTSSYVQKINYVRALQGELIRTINTLKSVRKSTVHISMPPKSSFLEQTEDPKASVVIELNPGKVISKEEVRGIQNLVSSSVEGLRPERVTVVDSTGLALSRTGDSVSALSTTMLERQKQIETELEAKIEDIVGRIVGQGNVVARVTADLDFNPENEQETIFDPEQAVVKSQEKQENVAESSRPVAGGEPAGAQGALPAPASVTETPASKQSIAKNGDRTQFELSKKTRNREKALGTIKRLSVAVLVNNTPANLAAPAGKEGEAATPVTLSEEKKKVIEKLVKDTAGIVSSRDSVTVESTDFATEDMDKADQFNSQQERRRLIYSLIRYGTIALFVLLFFTVVVRPFIRWLTGLTATKVEAVLPKTVEELEQMQDSVTNALPGLANLPLLEETVDLEKAEGELMKEKIVGLIEGSPHKAAQIISEWLASADPQQTAKKGRR